MSYQDGFSIIPHTNQIVIKNNAACTLYISYWYQTVRVDAATPLASGVWQWINKLTPYGTDGRLFATDVSVKFQVT